MNQETILGKIKNQPNYSKKNDKVEKKVQNEQKQIQQKIMQSNVNKLSKLFKLSQQEQEIEEDKVITQQFDQWKKSIKPQQIIVEYKNNKHLEFQVEELKQYLQVQQKEKDKDQELNYEEMNDEEIQKELLDQKLFEGYEYKQKQKQKKCLVMNNFYFDYIYNGLNKSFEKQLEITLQNKQKQWQQEINLDLSTILQSQRDLYLNDFESQNEQEYINTILTHIIHQNIDIHKQQQKSDNQVCGYVNLKTLILVHYKHEAFKMIQMLLEIQNFQNDNLIQKLEEQLFSEETAFNDDFFVALRIKKDVLQPSLKLNKADVLISTTKYLNKEKFQADSNLSSLRFLFIYKFNNYLQTNIEELKVLINKMNKIPNYNLVTSNFGNISKIYTENVSQFYRQNIIYSEFQSLELNSIASKLSQNYRGQMRMKNFYTNLLDQNILRNKQIEFQNIVIQNAKNEFQERFNYIQNKYWPEKRIDASFEKSIIIVRNYFFYKKVKILLQKKHSPVGFISEHTPRNKIQSILVQFNQGKFKYILITERALFYEVCKPQRYHNLIFLQIPFLLQTITYLMENLENIDQKNRISLLYSKFDFYELEKIIGTTKSIELINQKNKFNLTTINQF